MGQAEYNAHYAATAAKGICWNCKRRPAHRYTATLKAGKVEVIESLWCQRCKLKLFGASGKVEASK